MAAPGRGFPFFLFRVGAAGTSAAAIDATLTKKQLQALRRRLRQAGKLRDAQDDRRRKYLADLQRDVNSAFGIVEPEQQEAIVEALPQIEQADSPRQDQPTLRLVDWDKLVNHKEHINKLRNTIRQIEQTLINERIRRDEEEIELLLMAMD